MSLDITLEELRQRLQSRRTPEEVKLIFSALVEDAAGCRVMVPLRAAREANQRTVYVMRARTTTRRVAEVMELSIRTVQRWTKAEQMLRRTGGSPVAGETETE